MSLYLFKIPYTGEIHRKAIVLPRKNILHSRKEAPRRIHFSGSLTVEAAVVLPLLTYFFVSILFFFRIMQVQIVVQDAINSTGRKMALSQEQNESIALAKAKVLFARELYDEGLLENYVEGGVWGVSFSDSEFDEEQVHIKVKYQISLPMQLFWEVKFNIQQRADCRRWNGWHYSTVGEAADRWVYVTETGTVFHLAETCSHLELSIRSVKKEQLPYLRNENGERYQECSQCKAYDIIGGNVYIANQGECYHVDLNCSGIKRTVYMVRMSEVNNRSCCSRCGMSDIGRLQIEGQ